MLREERTELGWVFSGSSSNSVRKGVMSVLCACGVRGSEISGSQLSFLQRGSKNSSVQRTQCTVSFWRFCGKFKERCVSASLWKNVHMSTETLLIMYRHSFFMSSLSHTFVVLFEIISTSSSRHKLGSCHCGKRWMYSCRSRSCGCLIRHRIRRGEGTRTWLA